MSRPHSEAANVLLTPPPPAQATASISYNTEHTLTGETIGKDLPDATGAKNGVDT